MIRWSLAAALLICCAGGRSGRYAARSAALGGLFQTWSSLGAADGGACALLIGCVGLTISGRATGARLRWEGGLGFITVLL